jgi:hypothetical protein
LSDDSDPIVVALPLARDRIHRPRNIRSTLIASSHRSLRELGRFDEYVRLLEPSWRELPSLALPAVWLPLEAGVAHYRACDALRFTVAEQHAIGREVGDRIHGTFLGAMIRGAKGVGVSPWNALAQSRRLYERLFDGGAVCVTRAGPKDARMELVANPLVAIPYFRNAMRGLWQVAIEFFCTKAYLNETGRTEDSYKVRISWA